MLHQAKLLMKGKTVVITGGTSGIGEVAAEALAQMGARIILVARSRSRADATLTRLRESGPNVTHSVYFADLARLAEMKRVAAEIAIREPPIDVLINNAGHYSALDDSRMMGSNIPSRSITCPILL
jgi:short-subunit dehydrogenase